MGRSFAIFRKIIHMLLQMEFTIMEYKITTKSKLKINQMIHVSFEIVNMSIRQEVPNERQNCYHYRSKFWYW